MRELLSGRGNPHWDLVKHIPATGDSDAVTILLDSPTSRFTELGCPLGVWDFLSIAYHLHCEMLPCVVVPPGRDVGRCLQNGCRWVEALHGSPSHTSVLCMNPRGGHTDAIFSTTPMGSVHVAMGFSQLVYLSPHTCSYFENHLAPMLPFEILWRALLPQLVIDWDSGGTERPMRWISLLKESCVARMLLDARSWWRAGICGMWWTHP